MATQEVKGKTKEQVTKELAVKATTALALPTELTGSWGAEEATAEDIIIPKVLLMHGQSDKVLTGEKSQGELIRSTDLTTLAKRGETAKFIAFKMWKTWRIMELVDGQYEYRREEPWTASNTELPWDYQEEGKTYRRDQAYNFYALEANTLDFPLRLQFTRTSRKAGKVLADHFAHSRMENRPPATRVFEIGSEFINGEKNKYFVFTARAGEGSTLTQVTACKKWFDVITKNAATIKDHEVVEKETVTQTEEF